MEKWKEVIIVEGKYDKIKLESMIDAFILTTDGFSLFKQKNKINLIKELAKKRGIIILTDSDGAGFKIRSYIKGVVDNKYIKNAFIPDVFGKEKRKTQKSREGKIGVEGIDGSVIIKALLEAGASRLCRDEEDEITSYDLYAHGLFGRENSKQKRDALLELLSLPQRLSKKELLNVLNTKFTLKTFNEFIGNLKNG